MRLNWLDNRSRRLLTIFGLAVADRSGALCLTFLTPLSRRPCVQRAGRVDSLPVTILATGVEKVDGAFMRSAVSSTPPPPQPQAKVRPALAVSPVELVASILTPSAPVGRSISLIPLAKSGLQSASATSSRLQFALACLLTRDNRHANLASLLDSGRETAGMRAGLTAIQDLCSQNGRNSGWRVEKVARRGLPAFCIPHGMYTDWHTLTARRALRGNLKGAPIHFRAARAQKRSPDHSIGACKVNGGQSD